MATPKWLKDIGDALRPIGQGLLSSLTGGIIGGTSSSPTAQAAQGSIAAQTATGDPDAGKGASAAGTFLGLSLTREGIVKLAIFGVLGFVIFKAAKKL